MTRQMADDEVLRVFRRDAELAASARAKESTDYSRSRAHESESAIAAVAALQAERDALRDGHESAKKSIKLGQDLVTAMANAMHEAGATFDMGTLKVVNTRAERAESALEALRGQVAGLVSACEELDAAARAWDDAPGSVQGLGDTDGRDCDGPEYQRLVRAINARDAALLAIKERMG